MGLISQLSSLFNTQGISPSSSSKHAQPSSASGASSQFGEAFILQINETKDSSGVETDSLSLDFYTKGAGKASLTHSSASGSSLGSAFEQLLASLEGASAGSSGSVAGSSGSGASSSSGSGSVTNILQFMESAFATLEKQLAGGSSGSGSSSSGISVGIFSSTSSSSGSSSGAGASASLLKELKATLATLTNDLETALANDVSSGSGLSSASGSSKQAAVHHHHHHHHHQVATTSSSSGSSSASGSAAAASSASGTSTTTTVAASSSAPAVTTASAAS